MPRDRRTRPPQNVGATRPRSMRNNTRAARPMPFQQGNFQGGVGQGPPVTPGAPPRPTKPGGQPGATQCPAGQQLGPKPDGSMGCVPVPGAGQAGAPRRAGGAGVPTGIMPPKNREGY